MESHIIVTESASNLRSLGRRSLAGNWKAAALISFLLLLLTAGPQILLVCLFGENPTMESLSNFYLLLVYGPLYLGYAGFIRCLVRRQEARVGQLFDGFEMFLKAFSLYFMMILFTTLWTFLLVIPGIIASYRYSLAFYLLLDDPEMGVMDAIRKSKDLMYGNKWKLFCLDLSFIGWSFLAVLTCGIGFIWVLPYMETSRFSFYEIIVGNLKTRHEYVETEEAYEQPDSRSDESEEPKSEADETK